MKDKVSQDDRRLEDYNGPYGEEMTQPIYDFQADDIYKAMIKNVIGAVLATKIIQDYIDEHGLLDSENIEGDVRSDEGEGG